MQINLIPYEILQFGFKAVKHRSEQLERIQVLLLALQGVEHHSTEGELVAQAPHQWFGRF